MTLQVPAVVFPEDAYLTLRWISYDDADGQAFSLCEMSTRQFFRLLPMDARVVIQEFGAMRGQAWVGIEAFSGVATVERVLDVLHDEGLDVIDFSALLEGWLSISTHDDGEVHLAAPRGFDLRPHALAAVQSRGFDADAILAHAEAHPGFLLTLAAPSSVLAAYATFDDYLASRS